MIDINKRLGSSAFACLAVAVLAAACGSDSPRSGGGSRNAETHWTYRGATGPAAWGGLDAASARCADGTIQSPIDVNHPTEMALPDLHPDYQVAAVTIQDNGHTEQIVVPPGSSAVLGGTTFRLEQMHFHAPSEHRVNGRSFPVEFHFVHRDQHGGVAVIAVMATEGAENPNWAPILGRLPTRTSLGVGPVNIDGLLPHDLTSTRYEGSLTTPPCSEPVHWVLIDSPLELSARQIAALTAHYAENNRPRQPINGRLVAHDASRGD